MKFSIKQAGILVAILAIVVLALAGCLCAVNVSSSGESDLNSIDTNYMTTADKEYLLQGEREEMAEIWSAAMLESVKYNKHIKLTLMNDWVAKVTDLYITQMGTGYGFNYGRFEIVSRAEITLDLNGHTIDKNVTGLNLEGNKKPDSQIFSVLGTFNLVDSKYDVDEVNRVYEQYKDQDAEATDRVLLQNLSKINCGKITGNDSRHAGGAIEVIGTFNMYGGMIVGNETTVDGGAIYAESNSSLTIYNGMILGNKALRGGGIFSRANDFNVYGGIIAENQTHETDTNANAFGDGGGIFISTGSHIVQDCIISHNKSSIDGGGIHTFWSSAVNLTRVVLAGNYSKRHGSAMYGHYFMGQKFNNVDVINNVAKEGAALRIHTPYNLKMTNVKINNNKSYSADGVPAGFYAVNVSGENSDVTVECNGVEVANNELICPDETISIAQSASAFMMSGAYATTTLKMRNVSIINNKANINVPAFLNYSDANVMIGDNVTITENTASTGELDVYLKRGQKFQVTSKLDTDTTRSWIGLQLDTNYGDTPFTTGYSRYNSTIQNANTHFYLTNSDKALELVGGEVQVSTTTKPTIKDIQWRYKVNDNVDVWHNVQGSSISFEYNKNGYLISNTANEVIKIGGTDKVNQDLIANKGKYSYTLTNASEYKYPVFTVTINPKKVDIVWSKTELIYTGAIQAPTATIAEDANCSVTVTSGQINVGNGYVVTATALGNPNYEINLATKSTTFSIKPLSCIIGVVIKNYTKEYNGKVVSLPSDWYTLSTTFSGQDRFKPIDVLFDIDYSAFIPQFNGADSATALGDYTITLKAIDNLNEVFAGNSNYIVSMLHIENTGLLKITQPSVVRPSDNSGYDFLLSENGKRVNYKDKDLIHGDNDSAISTFVLGNIAPNTSIQTFVSNLSFDITKITIYNRAGDVVYGESAISYYTDNINNGLEVAVGTGWRIEYKKLNSEESETIYLSVLGDLTGDGKVNSADVNYIRKLISDSTLYASLNDKPYIQLSALIINNGKLTNADGEILWNIVCGKMDIVDFL